MKKLALEAAVLCLFAAAGLSAQDHDHHAAPATPAATAEQKPAAETLKPPPGWVVRLDKPDAPGAPLSFVAMPPGWHITTGPAAILYHPDTKASGRFFIESETFYFPSEHPREGFGFFFGGTALDGPGQAYIYFLLRGDGRFLVKRRAGDKTEVLIPWTPDPAIVPHDPQKNVRNVLKAVVGADSVDFYANGTKLASLPRKDLAVDGVVGLRINHAINIHVSSLKVEEIR
jgi:hypothetical protein